MSLELKDVVSSVEIQKALFDMDIDDMALPEKERFAASVCAKQLGTVLDLLSKVSKK